MKKNKNYYKLTLQFNDSDIHEEALSTIKQLDRKKSEFIAQCIVFYMRNSGDDPERIKNMLVGNNFDLSEQSFDNINSFIEDNTVNNKNFVKTSPAPKKEKDYDVGSENISVENKSKSKNKINNSAETLNTKVDEEKVRDNTAPTDIPGEDKDKGDISTHTNEKITNTIGYIDEDDLLNALDIFNNN